MSEFYGAIEMYPELDKYRNIDKINHLRAANFGTGMGYYDFCYDDLKVQAFNFSLTTQSLEFDYRLMNYYYGKFQSGCKICLVLPYCIFLANHLSEFDRINERYYSILPEKEVASRCSASYEAYMERVRGNKDWKTQKKLELLEPLDEEQMKQQTRDALDNWMRQLNIISYTTGEMNPGCITEIESSKKWLKKILGFCEEGHFEPVIIIPPMSQTLLDKMSMQFRKTHFYDILHEIVDEKIQVLDYSYEREFCNPKLYGWPGFLVKEAAKDFTKDVLTRIGVL